jgi:hypothetical protein
MSPALSKKMLALNVVLLAVLLVSLPLQVHACWPDWFFGALADWNECTYEWAGAVEQVCSQAQNQQEYESCMNAADSTLRNCWANIAWLEANPDSCAMAQTAYYGCLDSYDICAGAGISPADCSLTRNECELASKLYLCQ